MTNVELSLSILSWWHSINILIPRQNRHHFADNIYKCIFLNENVWSSLKISLKSVPKFVIKIPSLVRIMACYRPGDKPLSKSLWLVYWPVDDIKNNAWVTVNNDFLVTSGVICQWFSRVFTNGTRLWRHGDSTIALGNRNVTTACPRPPGHCESTEGLWPISDAH